LIQPFLNGSKSELDGVKSVVKSLNDVVQELVYNLSKMNATLIKWDDLVKMNATLVKLFDSDMAKMNNTLIKLFDSDLAKMNASFVKWDNLAKMNATLVKLFDSDMAKMNNSLIKLVDDNEKKFGVDIKNVSDSLSNAMDSVSNIGTFLTSTSTKCGANSFCNWVLNTTNINGVDLSRDGTTFNFKIPGTYNIQGMFLKSEENNIDFGLNINGIIEENVQFKGSSSNISSIITMVYMLNVTKISEVKIFNHMTEVIISKQTLIITRSNLEKR